MAGRTTTARPPDPAGRVDLVGRVDPVRHADLAEPNARAEPFGVSADAFADVIVVAAGNSSRMGGGDKLARIVAGLPLLAHCLASIAAAPEVRRIVIVTAADRVAAIVTADWLPGSVAAVVAGGGRRQESVLRGFEALDGLEASSRRVDRRAPANDADVGIRVLSTPTRTPTVVLVHDGARPLVSTRLVSAIARAAAEHGAAIPVLPVGDTIKRLAGDGTVVGAGDRSSLAAAQTPQGIRSDVLRDAFAQFPPTGPDQFTDEAALLEACRIAVHAIPGDERNFKVTLPSDLARVEAALTGQLAGGRADEGRPVAFGGRVGLGSDSHPFGPGTGLALGGVVVGGAPRLHGHSDGDVVLHAIADALLGAAGLGDLGRIFPAGPETPRGIASSELLAEVSRRVAAAGYAVTNLDCTIIAARPRLAGLLPTIGVRIAELLAVGPAAVNIKASSGNLAGMEGAGRGISAEAIVVLAPLAALSSLRTTRPAGIR